MLTGVVADHRDGLFLSFRHTCRSYLDTVYPDVGEQVTGNHELLMRQEAHATRLLAIAERAVHYLYFRI